MPIKRKSGTRKRVGRPRVVRRRVIRRRRMVGGSRFTDFFKKAYNFVKDNKLISRAGTALSGILPGKYGAIAGTIGNVASKVGLGRRRRRVVRRRVVRR